MVGDSNNGEWELGGWDEMQPAVRGREGGRKERVRMNGRRRRISRQRRTLRDNIVARRPLRHFVLRGGERSNP